MDVSKKEGLLIIAGSLGSPMKSSNTSSLASFVGHGLVLQVDRSRQAFEPISVEDPPEYPRTWALKSGVAHEVSTRIFIGGVPLDEHVRREALPRRRLAPSDIPKEPWCESYAEYDLREDGAIVSSKVSIELGWVQAESGTVAWVRM